MFEKEDDCRNRKFWGQRRENVGIDSWLLDMLEARRNRQQDLDGIFAAYFPVTAVQPSGDGQNKDHKSVSQNTDEEEDTR